MRLGLDLTLFASLSIGSETTASTEEVGDALVASFLLLRLRVPLTLAVFGSRRSSREAMAAGEG